MNHTQQLVPRKLLKVFSFVPGSLDCAVISSLLLEQIFPGELSCFNIQGHTRDILLPTSMWRYTFEMWLKKNKMKELHGVLSRCYFNICYTSSGESSVFLLTMQSLFMIIGMFKLLISIVMPLLVWKKKVIYHQCNVEILQIGILYGWS